MNDSEKFELFEAWADRTFGESFKDEDMITYFRMYSAFLQGYDVKESEEIVK